ncbi:MAG: DUF2065 domain-containing protein [Deltaproteobacteria bacterium]|nr:DUF2065 domain-containing protein [Deltaproteobacteria bacterium]
MEFFLCVIGMVMFLEGLPYAVFPKKMKQWIIKMLETPHTTLRTMGLTLMGVGVFLVYLAKGLCTH